MADTSGWRYYGALFASLVSSIGWIGAVVGAIYLLYLGVTGRSTDTVVVVTGSALVVGIVFARVEKRLYTRDRGE